MITPGMEETRQMKMRKRSEEDKNKIVEMYKSGVKVRDISAELGISQASIYEAVRGANVKMRGTGYRYKPTDRQKIVKYYEMGLTVRDIVKLMDLGGEQTIYRILRENGTKLRNE